VQLNLVNEIAALKRLTVGQLRQRFAEVFGEATQASNRIWLVKRIAWRMQARAEGDLSERARRRAAELARDADLRLNPPQSKATTTAAAGRRHAGDDALALFRGEERPLLLGVARLAAGSA
jgi:hypothetical protein